MKNSNYLPILIISLLVATRIPAQRPVINSFSPSTGTVGTTVIIAGSNFNSTAGNNIVYFGGARALVSGASANSLTVTVPAGATYQPISVTTNGLTAYSSKPFIVTFPGGPGFTDSSFNSKTDLQMGFGTNGVASADLDQDGRVDIVAVSTYSKLILVQKNTGTVGAPAFISNGNYATGNQPGSISIADIDGDGKQDVVVANGGSNSVSIFKNISINQDTIILLSKQDLPVGNLPLTAVVCDLDNDGRPDIVCTNANDNTVSILRNTSSAGTISFASKIDLNTGKYPDALTTGDLDNDGKNEIVVTNMDDNSISVFKNNCTPGVMTFNSKIDFGVATGPSNIAAGDLDGDGNVDIVVGSAQAGQVVLENTTTTTISFALPKYFSVAFGSGTASTSIGDLDGDGKPDIAFTTNFYYGAVVLKNLSVPDSISFAESPIYRFGDIPSSGNLADLDNDGKLDLYATKNGAANITVLKNTVTRPYVTNFTPTINGNGGTVTITGINFNTTSSVRFGGVPASSYFVESPTSIKAVVDTGSTGDVVVTTNYGSAKRPGFTFSRPPTITYYTPSAGGTGTVVTITGTNFTGTTSVKFGGQPATSFVIISPTVMTATVGTISTGVFEISVTNPFGTATMPGFYTGLTIQSFFPTSGPAGTFVTIKGTHFSNTPTDNHLYFGASKANISASNDSVITAIVPPGASYQPISITTNHFTAYSSKPFTLTFKSAADEFTDSSFVDKLDSAADNFLRNNINIGDFNGDGKPDAVIISSAVWMFTNTSSPNQLSFSKGNTYTALTTPYRACPVDINGDGKMDFVTVNPWEITGYIPSISVFINTGSGNNADFAPRLDFPLPSQYEEDFRDAVITDFDADGKPDIALLSGQSYAILQNTTVNGVISFGEPVKLFGGYISAERGAFADIDGDGKPDLIAGAMIFRNISANGKIAFAPAVPVPTGDGPRYISVGDLDNDGKIDVAAVCGGNDAVTLARNTSLPGQISFAPYQYYQLDQNPGNLSIADLNGDGKPDLSITMNSKNVAVLKNLSTPGTISFANPIEYPEEANPMDVTAADMDGDGRTDIIAANPNGHDFTIFRNNVKTDGLATALIEASGPTEFCSAGNVALKAASIAGASYQWYKDGVVINSANDSFFVANTSGAYSVKTTKAGVASTSAAVLVTVKSITPAPVINSIGPNNFCEGSNVFLHSSLPDGNQWYRNDTLVMDNSDSVFTVAKAGIYKVRANATVCPSSFSNQITVAVSPLPAASITAPATNFCAGDSITLIANTNNSYSYQWFSNNDPVPTATLTSLTTKYSGTFAVTTTINGCSNMSDPVTITRTPTPAKPAVSATGSVLKSSVANGNQWYKDGVEIPGATSQTYTATTNGNYTVQVTINGCQGPMSNNYGLVTTGVIVIDNTHFIKLNPNPVRSILVLNYHLDGINALNMDLVNLEGRTVNSWQNLKNGNEINVARFANSIYFARLYSKDKSSSFVFKILKQ